MIVRILTAARLQVNRHQWVHNNAHRVLPYLMVGGLVLDWLRSLSACAAFGLPNRCQILQQTKNALLTLQFFVLSTLSRNHAYYLNAFLHTTEAKLSFWKHDNSWATVMFAELLRAWCAPNPQEDC